MNPRGIAWYILKKVFNERKLITDNYPFLFENVQDERDRRLVVEIVYGTCRFRGRLDYVLSHYANPKRTEPEIWLLLASAAYQILFLTRTPDYAIINETVTLAKQAFQGSRKKSGFINAVLKKLSREKDNLSFPGPENFREFVEHNLSFPYWLGMKWLADYGKEQAIQMMKALNFRKPVVFRCFNGLESFGAQYRFHPTPYIDGSFEANVPIYLIRAGSCYVMNESSQLVAELFRNFSGRWVLDAAASPGGKGFILQSIKGIKNVVFNDIAEKRLQKVLENSRDLAVPVPLAVQSDFMKPAFEKESFNAILLDAPCTGTGTISGHPELKWIRKPGEIGSRARLQNQMIRNAFQLLKRGGILVYSTCSLEREEGEDVVFDFVAGESEAKLIDPFSFSGEKLKENFRNFITREKTLRIFPDKYLDGFFVAMMQKKL